jgi:hypothetical protein
MAAQILQLLITAVMAQPILAVVAVARQGLTLVDLVARVVLE